MNIKHDYIVERGSLLVLSLEIKIFNKLLIRGFFFPGTIKLGTLLFPCLLANQGFKGWLLKAF